MGCHYEEDIADRSPNYHLNKENDANKLGMKL